jgi:hypothetical protein
MLRLVGHGRLTQMDAGSIIETSTDFETVSITDPLFSSVVVLHFDCTTPFAERLVM